jgi:nucleotide-binding universal stress UspA family protein
MSGTSESPVVVGVDGSQAAQAALRWAIDYARCVNAPVHAVAVLAQPLVASDGVTVPLPQPMWDADLEDRFEAEAERWLANALPAPYAEEPIPAVSLSTIPGDPCDVLVEHAHTAAGGPRQPTAEPARRGADRIDRAPLPAPRRLPGRARPRGGVTGR